MRPIRFLVIAALLLPAGSAFGASKEMQEMQRDIAQLQDQVRTLQSGFDQKMSALQTLVQQALDAATKANTNVSVLNAGVTSTLERELKQSLTPIAGLAAKVDNTNNDVSEVRNSVADLNTSMNKVLQILNDINNNLKVMQAPAAPPPGAAGPGAAGSPPPAADAIFTNANRDYTGGKLDLAISEYQDFLKFYPNDPNAARAQFNIGEAHYTQQKNDQAAQDFDVVIEKYPEDTQLTPQAYFMKGMALKATRRTEAVKTFQALVAKYPRSDSASQAKEQLRALGVSLTSPSAKRRR
ncbi:MAG TPA: tetratricopeptide repeat protein [Bryobacteraceae bacterium]|nr:tetratricopeptide repeat protein [Bryobacteraceae bacterium]